MMPIANLYRQRAVRPQQRMMPIANLYRQRAVRPRERMNSPLEIRKVHLRGLGGPAVCGIPGTCASAAGAFRRNRSLS
jgi:hypothetical protein